MKLQIIGCSHHTTPVEIRERLAFQPDQIPMALRQLRDRFPCSEAVLLSTCNRVELFLADEDPRGGLSQNEVADFFADFHGLKAVDILNDLFERTGEDAIRHSKKPVAYSHCCPAALLDHPRNKTDEQLRFIVEHDGFVGVTTYPWFLPKGADSTVDDCVAAIDYVINQVGKERVGIGTDFTQGQDAAFFDWLSLDKGTGRRLIVRDWDVAPQPVGFQRLSEFPNLTGAMVRRGWSERRIRRILGENWVAFLREVWGN